MRPLLVSACLFCAVLAAPLLTGCTAMLTGFVIEPAVGSLQKQTDVDLVCDGAASYLLMIDSLLEANPDDARLLLIGTQSYSGSVAALEACGAEQARLDALSAKAKGYGTRLLATLVPLEKPPGEPFAEALARLRPADAEALFWGAYGWLAWVEQQQGSPAAMADLIVIEAIMARLLELDEGIENGGPHIFFGTLLGAKPELLGGDPERSRYHFERALALGDRSFLLAQVLYAETFARMTFDRRLHDELLKEVLTFELDKAPANALTNQIAKRRARALLAEDFFGG